MKLKHYLITGICGCIAALVIAQIVLMSDAQTTIDALFLKLTINGQDIGDRVVMLTRELMHQSSFDALMGVSYLVGHSILEEIIKFVAFYIAFRFLKPNTLREIIIMGFAVGVGFATIESFGFYSNLAILSLIGFTVRSLGHGLFTALIALLFGMGYFSQLRWVDRGARGELFGWIVRYKEFFLRIFWTVLGLIVAALIHSIVNICAALGGQSISLVVLMVGWLFCAFMYLKPTSGRPYGAIIREVDLMQTIAQAREDLMEIVTNESRARKRKSRSGMSDPNYFAK